MKRLAIAAVLCLAAFAASATEEGQWRATVAAAFSDFEGDSSFPVDDSTIGLQIMAQYQFNSWLGAEAGYHNTGTFETDIGGSGSDTEVSFSGLSFSAIGYIPLPSATNENIDLYARLGYFDFDVDLTSPDLTGGTQASIGHDTGLVAGLGGTVKISEDFSIKTEYAFYDVDDSDLWTVTLGMEYRF